ncbi:MAG TPA: hypothetical protein VKX96_09635 [Chloroflexota bacterium]|nr:hypothetical protein [Chloroflexota bacterium]
MAMLELSFPPEHARGRADTTTGRMGWKAIDPDVEARIETEFRRPRRWRELLFSWLVEYNKY